MKYFCACLVIALFILFNSAHYPSVSASFDPTDSSEQSAFEKREAAYRANNIGVALLEQYKAKDAAESFTHALAIKPDLLIARINLAIALYYLPDVDGARREAEKALQQDSNAPQPHYLLGLIARAQNRFDEAVTEFQKVLKVDTTDVGTNVNIGQIYVQQKKYPEAIAAFRKAIESEPYNETALYNLGLLLTRTGKKEEGRPVLQKFQQFKATGGGTSIGNNYLEGGHYAEAVVSTGAESELVEKATPKVSFEDITASALPPFRNARIPQSRVLGAAGGAATLFDFDGDGDLDLVEAQAGAQRLFRNDGGKFMDVTDRSGDLAKDVDGVATAVIAGDVDNDGKPDLFVLRYGKSSLYHNDGNGHFSDITAAAKIPAYNYLARAAAFVDYDHDGDLDLLIPGGEDISGALPMEETLARRPRTGNMLILPIAATPGLLLRNNGDGTFTDVTARANLSSPNDSSAVVPTDFDNRRDVDLLVTNDRNDPGVRLWRNMRDGSFRDVARESGLGTGQLRQSSSVAVGDINKDGYPDFFFGLSDRAGAFAISDGKDHFHLTRGPDNFNDYPNVRPGKTNCASQLVDYDNDGLLDLVTVVELGPPSASLKLRVWRNVGDGWKDVSDYVAPGISATIPGAGRALLLAADLDGDGDTDLIFGTIAGGLHVVRNDGGNRNHSIKVDLHGRVSNKSAVEAKVEMRAGSLYQKLETYSASPAPAPADLIFGLGKREKPDAVRVLWPAGIVQAETDFPDAPKNQPGFLSLDLTELDRKPSSCPYLYTWNGDRFEFITDFMGGGEMGYLEEPAASEPRAVASGSTTRRYNKPDPIEYVRITSDQLKEKDGGYELRVTNELEESMFVDRLQLLAVAHPIGTEVYPNEGMSDPPKPFKLFLSKNARPPLSAIDDKGHDVLDLVSRMDRRWPYDFRVDRIRGYADEHRLTLKLAEDSKVESPKSKVLLLLTGWTDYAWSSDNVAASQAKKEMKPPSLQVKDKAGNWRTVIEDIGIPVGRPQTVTVDLTDKFLSASREVRILTNMRVYWDQILVGAANDPEPAQISRLDPIRADLRWRGFSAEITPDGREPFGYDYQKVSFTSPWKVMTGHYTREGDVRELLLTSDDMFVISRPGDELMLSFDAMALPSLPKGWTRTFLLYADGFSKEMDINSASPDQLAPLPFHGMSRYPYSWPEHYPSDTKHLEYLEKYNTRVVTSPVPSIATEFLRR